MSKLYFYRVRGKARFWIKDFLDIHSQAVVLNGSNQMIAVSSVVPQGSVLGHKPLSLSLSLSLSVLLT